MQSIVLPEPARHIWPRIQLILEGIASFLDSSVVELFSLGGGTMLASRWAHRKSTDIDILAQKGSGIRELLEEDYLKDFVNLCVISGASRVEFLPGTMTVTVQFPEGKWDLTEADPFIKAEETILMVDGVPVKTLSIAQILSGKLVGRAFDLLTRDVFDLAVCSLIDPMELNAALQRFHMSDVSITLFLEDMREFTPKYRLEAPVKIIEPNPRWKKFMSSAPMVVANYIEAFVDGGHSHQEKDDLPPRH